MTKNQSTKRAFCSSVAAVVICVAMLIGTTFAWFTSTASTGVNKIESGTLKVDIVDAAGESIQNKTMSFVNKNESANILWEPGATFHTPVFKIKSLGNLALKYKLILNGVTGTNKLLEVLKFSVVKPTGEAMLAVTAQALPLPVVIMTAVKAAIIGAFKLIPGLLLLLRTAPLPWVKTPAVPVILLFFVMGAP